jgi:pimeloyl-ACP methyl ester carboxylesterase
MEPVVDEVLDLQDGRRLAYCEWGSREGAPVVFINGSPTGSRLWIPDERVTEDRAVRLVTFDRPGTGRSDPKAPRRLSDVPLDVAALADALEIERFPVIGYSKGGVYAAACAALLGPRVTGAAIVSTRHLALYNVGERPESYDELDAESRAVFDLAQQDPLAAAELCKQQDAEWVEQLRERPESIWDGPAEERAPEGDRWFWRDAERTASFYSSMRETLRQGIEGYKWESLDVFLPWGFRLSEISVPVTTWYGVQDARFQGRGLELVKWVEERIPGCTVVTWDDAGHMGLVKYWDTVLDSIL